MTTALPSYTTSMDVTGSAGLVSGGGQRQGPELLSELRSGVGLVHSTREAVDGNETRGGRGQPERSPHEEARVRTQSRMTLRRTSSG